MASIINKIMSNIPNDWTLIPKEEYPQRSIYVSDEFQIIGAYETGGELLVINHYPELDSFIEDYDKQFQDIKEVIKNKDWKEISAINPIKNSYLKKDKDEKLYMSVFETYNNQDKVSVQIFYEDGKNIIGISTFVNKENGINIISSVKKDLKVKTALGFFVKNT